MKENSDHNLRSISSFSDFLIEKKRLSLKKKLIEVRLQFNAGELKELLTLKRALSFNQIEDFIQKFSGIFERIINSDKRAGTNDTSAGTQE